MSKTELTQFIGITIVVIFIGYIIFAGLTLQKTEVIVENTSIISLKEISTTTGSFFLGCGNIDGEFKYVMYTSTNDGGFKKHIIPASVTTIYEDEDTNPYVSEYNLWEVLDSDIKREKASADYPYYKLHVPKGTIIRDYKIGADIND
jgi:hypothetical protein